MPFDMTDLRRAGEADADVLAEREQELFPENWLSAQSLVREMKAPGFCLIVGSALIGYALARWTPDYIDLVRLGVLPEFQGQGIGKGLLLRVLWAADRPVMLTVDKKNLRAIRLYQQYGFTIEGHVEQAWFMLRQQETLGRV